MSTSIVIVDDHPMIRHGLKSVISNQDSYAVAGEASDGKSCLKLVEQIKPDIVILDITLKGSDGISLILRIKELAANIKIIMYSMHNSKEYVSRSLMAGAFAYVLKGDKIEEVIAAIDSVIQEKIYLSTSIPQTILSELIVNRRNTESAIDTLTPREYEVASLISQGNTPDQIAEILCISPKTVRVHRTNLMHKLSCSHVHELLLQLRNYFPQ
jgi:DNA-binding NarL/FixJ family response regulator